MTDASPDYSMLAAQLEALTADESDPLANSANFVALLWGALPNINWLGIYVCRDDDLVLGPFQGKPACVRIPVGRGVCGTSAAERRSMRVDDVDAFPGHIACDTASRSELVVPLVAGNELLAVLDIDSPSRGRFSAVDQQGIERLCEIFLAQLDYHTHGRFI